MFTTLALTFILGGIVGAVVYDLARWLRRRSSTQNLLRALDAGTIYYGRARRTNADEHEPQEKP